MDAVVFGPVYMLLQQPLQEISKILFLNDESQLLGSIRTEEIFFSNMNESVKFPRTANFILFWGQIVMLSINQKKKLI